MESVQNELEKATAAAIGKLREILQIREITNNKTTEKAKKFFESFQKEYSSLNPKLVWEHSVAGNHYQLMLSTDKDETIAVSISPNYYIPWALRNAIHPKESDFVVVDGYTLSVEQVMQIIDEQLDNTNIYETVINHAIVKKELEEIPYEAKFKHLASEDDLQLEFDAWRLKKGLTSISSYNKYLADTGLTQLQIEKKLRNKIEHNNFLDSLSLISNKDHFAKYKFDYTIYKLESYAAESENEVKELGKFLETQLDGLCLWNRKQFAMGKNIKNPSYQLNTCFHYQLDSEAADLLEKDPKTGLLPPIEMNGKWTFINILSIAPPELDEKTESIIRQRQVRKWLEEKKKTCSIQWLWGDTDIFPNQNIQES